MDLNGSTISAPPPGVLNLSNGRVTGNLVVRSGSVLRNLTIDGSVLWDQDVDGLEVTHCALRSMRCDPPQPYSHLKNAKVVANVFDPGAGGDFTAFHSPNPGDNVVFTDNLVKNCCEGIHLQDGDARAGVVISYNEFRGIHRHPIEVQCQLQGGLCQFNLIHQFHKNDTDQGEPPHDGRILISWACGPNRDRSVYSADCQITDNVILQDGDVEIPITRDAWKNCPIEIMGDRVTVARNWVWNTGNPAYTITRRVFACAGNVWMGVRNGGRWDLEPSWPNAPQWSAPTVTGDRNFALNDLTAPRRPTAGPRVTPGPGSTDMLGEITPDTAKPVVTDLKASAPAKGVIQWTWTALPSPVHYRIQATRGTQVLAEGDLPAGVGTVGASPVPDQWEVTATLSVGGAVVGQHTYQYRDASVSVPANPATIELRIRSTDGGRTWQVLQA